MRFRLVIARRAAADVDRLEDWLVNKNPSAAERVAPLLFDAFASLLDMPLRTPNLGLEVHELQVPFGRSAYVVRYEVLEDTVTVTRVFHALEDR